MTTGLDGAFYEPLGGDRYRSTEHTIGPWDPRFQHGGPPAALLARAIERIEAAWPATVARVSVDILGPVPVDEVAVNSRVLRSGRSVELLEAQMVAGGRPVVRAQAWRIRAAQPGLVIPSGALADAAADLPPALPDASVDPFAAMPRGYLGAIEWRQVGERSGGHAIVWGRMRHPLVPGVEPSGLQRVMIVADSGNGASTALPLDSWYFINPELTVHLAAPPQGEWICLDAQTRLEASGFGLTSSRLFDQTGLVAQGAQALYVAYR